MKKLLPAFKNKKIFSIVFLLLLYHNTYAQRPFVTVWSGNNLKLHLEGQYTFTWTEIENADINGKGFGADSLYINFPKNSVYRLSLKPVGENPLHRIKSRQSLMRIEQWGDVR